MGNLIKKVFCKNFEKCLDYIDNRNEKMLLQFNANAKEEEKIKEFNNIMEFANKVLEEFNRIKQYKHNSIEVKENPLIDVIRVLGKKLQTEYLTYLLLNKEEKREESIDSRKIMVDEFKPINNNGLNLKQLMKKVQNDKKVYLNKDVILPWAWNRKRLIDCISGIGEGRDSDKWKQDNNHTTELWLPIGVTWVSSGNHSISTGIIQGDGVITPTEIYDISPIYDYIYCDGSDYRYKHDNSIFQSVNNIEFAAIFEIGRLMIKNNISF